MEAVVLFVTIVDPLLLIITCQELRNPRGPYSMTCINMICIAAAWPRSSAQNRLTPFLVYRLHWTFRNVSFHFFKEPPGWSEDWYFKILDKKLDYTLLRLFEVRPSENHSQPRDLGLALMLPRGFRVLGRAHYTRRLTPCYPPKQR